MTDSFIFERIDDTEPLFIKFKTVFFLTDPFTSTSLTTMTF